MTGAPVTPPQGMSAEQSAKGLLGLLNSHCVHARFQSPLVPARDCIICVDTVAAIFRQAEAAARADERVKAWNEAIERALQRAKNTVYSKVEFGKRMELEHEVMKLKLPEAQPVEPAEEAKP